MNRLLRLLPYALCFALVTSSSLASAVADEAKEPSEHETEKAEPRFWFDAEVVTGFGKVDAVNLAPYGSLGSLRYVRESTLVAVSTPIFSLKVPISKHLAIGARLPLVIGQLSPDNDKARGAANFGNVELEAEYERELSHSIGFEFALHVATPTSRGDEIPEQEKLDKLGSSAPSVAYDKYSIARAAELAHGSENTALFESRRLGVVPKVALPMRFDRVKVEPYAKLENLIATFADAPSPVIVELVAGTRVAYALTDSVDVGARVWTNLTLTAHEGRDLNIGVVEPELRFKYEALRATIGGIVPFAGEPTHPEFGGVRVNLLFSF